MKVSHEVQRGKTIQLDTLLELSTESHCIGTETDCPCQGRISQKSEVRNQALFKEFKELNHCITSPQNNKASSSEKVIDRLEHPMSDA